MEEIDVITLSWLIGSIDGTLEIFFGYFQGTFYSFNKILLATIVDKKSKKILVKMAGKFSGCLQLFISDLNVENFKSSVKKAREDVKDCQIYEVTEVQRKSDTKKSPDYFASIMPIWQNSHTW